MERRDFLRMTSMSALLAAGEWMGLSNAFACGKTFQFFLLIENKKLTKIFSLTGNDIETSGLLYSAMFCTNQKNAFLICKSSIFIPHRQNYFSEK